tara:strand:+ start:613 stop:1065 length:453 start_codon:yes stop_codon:yes gene_type:complete
MAIDKDKDFTLTHYLRLAGQRTTNLDQVPFFLGNLNSPPALRRILELLAMVVWTVTDVAGTYTVGVSEVVLLVDTTSARTINLPNITLNPGRIILVKDKTGSASSNVITIDPYGSNKIDGLNTSFSLQANYGAVLLVGGNGSEWHTLALV